MGHTVVQSGPGAPSRRQRRKTPEPRCALAAWLVHRRFAPGIHFSWLTRDVALIWAVSALIAWLSTLLPIEWNQNRWINLLWLGLIGAFNLGVCCLLHSLVLKRLRAPLVNAEERG